MGLDPDVSRPLAAYLHGSPQGEEIAQQRRLG
jgi:hypothetical protein